MRSAKPAYIVMLGAPGAGKGTQAKMLAEELQLPHISSGDLFRENLRDQTPLGLLARQYIDRGDLVPDDVTIGMVAERLGRGDCGAGAILDGFPRTLAQASALDGSLAQGGRQISLVPLLEVSDEAIVARLAGRRVCRQCQAMYHTEFEPSRLEGVCDRCGGELYRRQDDDPETVHNRLFVYYKQTSPLIGYYYAHHVLVAIAGDRPADQVQADVLAAVLAVLPPRSAA